METQSRKTLKVAVTAFLPVLSIQMIDPIVALYARDYLDSSVTEVGLAVSFFFLSPLVFKIPLGLLLPRSQLKRGLVIATVLMTVGPITYFFTTSPSAMLLFRFAHGIGFATLLVTSITLVFGAGSAESRGMITFATVLAVALPVGPVLSSFLLATLGMRLTFLVAGLIVIPSILFSISLDVAQTVNVEEGRVVPGSMGARLRSVVTSKPVLSATLSHLSYSVLFGSLLSLGPIHLREFFGVSEANVASLFAGLYVVSFLSRMVLRLWVPTGLEQRLTSFALVTSLLGMAGMAFSSSLILFVMFFISLGIPHGLMFPTTAIQAMESSSPDRRALITGVHSTAFDLGAFSGANAVSALAALQGIQTAMFVTALVPILGLAGSWLLRNATGRATP